jgi:hypothetical protein
MGDFSVGDAIGSGFRLVGRAPLAVLAWAAVYLALVLAPTLALVRFGMPAIIAAVEQTQAHSGAPDPAGMMALQSGFMVWQPAVWLLSIVCVTVVMGAMFRAVLQPQEGRFGYLRLSRQELWLGLTYLVLMVMAVIMAFLLMLPMVISGAILAAMAGNGSSGAGGALLLALLGLGGFGAIIWVLLRLSLALPMSFAQGRFLLYESWDLTRGHALKIFLVYLVLVLALLVLEVGVAAVVGFSMFSHYRDSLAAAPQTPEAMLAMIQRYEPMIVAGGVIASVLAMAIHAIFVAPLALIYRELTAGESAL